jgi:hypothetical protein
MSRGRWCFDSHADGSYLLIPELAQIDVEKIIDRFTLGLQNRLLIYRRNRVGSFALFLSKK